MNTLGLQIYSQNRPHSYVGDFLHFSDYCSTRNPEKSILLLSTVCVGGNQSVHLRKRKGEMEGVGRRHCSPRLPSPSRVRCCLVITTFCMPPQGKRAFSIRPASLAPFSPPMASLPCQCIPCQGPCRHLQTLQQLLLGSTSKKLTFSKNYFTEA